MHKSSDMFPPANPPYPTSKGMLIAIFFVAYGLAKHSFPPIFFLRSKSYKIVQ